MSECTCPCPTCGSPDDYAELAKAARVLQADLDAAQDEIEARILASERDRELIRQLGVVVDHMAPAAYKAIMANGGANDDAPGDES